jgi:hypothetical protein
MYFIVSIRVATFSDELVVWMEETKRAFRIFYCEVFRDNMKERFSESKILK